MTLPPFASDLATSGSGTPPRPMNEAQFEALYRSTARSIWAYIYRLTGDASMSDDLLQKTFIRFLRANPVLAGDEHVRRYLFRTATTVVFDYFREAKRERDHVLPPFEAAGETDARDLRYDMRRVFSELKPQERALLWLAHVEGADHNEIGETLGVKSPSVRVLLFRARKRLRALLSKHGLGPEVTR